MGYNEGDSPGLYYDAPSGLEGRERSDTRNEIKLISSASQNQLFTTPGQP